MALPKLRWRIFLSLLIVVPVGFAFKLYSGPGSFWFQNYGAGVLYEIFWILVFFGIWPNKESVVVIPVSVFAGTCFLEILQLWNPPLLASFRSTFLGRTLIGTTFVIWDFPHYMLGCLLGWGWICKLNEES